MSFPKTSKGQRRSLFLRLFPWVVCALIFAYLFGKYPPAQVLASLRYVHVPFFVAYTLFLFLFIFTVDCWSVSWVLQRFGSPVHVTEIMPLRLATYLPMVLHYGAGQGAFAFFLKKNKNLPLMKVSGLLGFTMAVDLYLTLSLAAFGTFLTDNTVNSVSLTPWVRGIWAVATAGALACAFFGQRLPEWGWIRRLKGLDFLHAFHRAGPSAYLGCLIRRLPIHAALATSLFLIALAFGSHVPLATAISAHPLLVLIGNIPLTPGGLGTVQLATVELLRNHLSPPAGFPASDMALSMSLLTAFADYSLKAFAGALFLGQVARPPTA